MHRGVLGWLSSLVCQQARQVLVLLLWHAELYITLLPDPQARVICPRFAHLKRAGVEVVHVRAELSVINATMWSPDQETIAIINRSATADPANSTLLLINVASGSQTTVEPAVSSVSSCTFWTPDSQQFVSVAGAHASFVDRQTCAARLQQNCLPQRHLTHRAMCSRAGLVVVAQLDEKQGFLSICSLTGLPRELQVLRQIDTGMAITSLDFSPTGLLLAWVDCGDRVAYLPLTEVDGFLVQGQPCVKISELATGRTAELCKKPEQKFSWLAKPTTVASFAVAPDSDRAGRLSWASSGTRLCICSPLHDGTGITIRVQRMCLLS